VLSTRVVERPFTLASLFALGRFRALRRSELHAEGHSTITLRAVLAQTFDAVEKAGIRPMRREQSLPAQAKPFTDLVDGIED
jgi:hypothetical protein